MTAAATMTSSTMTRKMTMRRTKMVVRHSPSMLLLLLVLLLLLQVTFIVPTTTMAVVPVMVTGFQQLPGALTIPLRRRTSMIITTTPAATTTTMKVTTTRRLRMTITTRHSAAATSTTATAADFTRSSTTTTTTKDGATAEAANHLNPNRGDANGAALLLQDVNVYRGSSQILSNINWRVEPKQKWGLVGQNGCGKSTLLKAIMNELTSYDGTIIVDNTQTSIGYLQQTAVSGSTKTVYEEACDAMTEIAKARQELDDAERCVARHDDNASDDDDEASDTSSSSSLEDDLKVLDRAMSRYESVGGYTQQQTVTDLLKGLGFADHQLTMPCDELSGGWQMRVSFAKLLLKRPSLALLDEPSNHLDRPARQWLANYLSNYKDGAMVLVTHDSELLSSCQHIAEIGPGGKQLQIYKSCTYEQYLELKQQRSLAAQSEYEKNVKEAQRLQEFVDKYGASATKASAAQSRVKKIQKMKDLGLLDKPSVEVLEIERFKPRLKLPPPPPVHRGSDGVPLLALQNDATIGYYLKNNNNSNNNNDDHRDDDNDDDASSSSTTTTTTNQNQRQQERHELASHVNFEIHPGMKILIRGPNGAGKTTLLDTLRGTIPLLNGDRIENPSLRLGVFTQDLAQELDTSKRAVDIVTAYARTGDDGDINISDQQARSVLGGLGLTGDKSLRLVGELSGGEKARVALAMFALKPSNLYLLDEVSNHLDVEWYVRVTNENNPRYHARCVCLCVCVCVCVLGHVRRIFFVDSTCLFDRELNHSLLFSFVIKINHTFFWFIYSVEALSEALSTWGEDTGSIIVISHDKSFCEQVGFTHVLTLDGKGGMKLEQREVRESDWDTSGGLSTTQLPGPKHAANEEVEKEPTKETVVLDDKQRKQAFNAPKRIAKIEVLVEELEEKIAEIDQKMIEIGNDVGQLVDLNKEKENLQEKVTTLMTEWEELEVLLALAGNAQ